MPTKHYHEFAKFCQSFHIEHIEHGYFKGDDWQFSSLKAPYNRLYIIMAGEGILFIDGREALMEKGYAYVVPAGMDFRCDSPRYLEKLFLHFMTDSIDRKDPFGDAGKIYKMPMDITPYKAVVKDLKAHNVHAYYRIKAMYEAQIYEMVESLIASGEYRADELLEGDLARLYEQIEKNLSAGLRTSWLAEQMGMSRSGLSKYFRKATGTTVKKTITERLIKKAQILLLTTEKSVTEIAEILGYEDPLYMTKVFSRTVGVAPSVYRKENSQ